MPSLELPRILWNDIGRLASLSASAAASGYPAKAAQNDNTFEFYQPTAVPATYRWDFGTATVFSGLGVAAHNLGSVGASVQVQYSHNDTDWLDASDVHTPQDDGAILLIFPPQFSRYARAYFTVAVPTVGVIKTGPVLSVSKGIPGQHAPLPLSRVTELRPSESEGGQWLGASVVRAGLRGSAQWQDLTSIWYRENFVPFVREARLRARPFFFAWQPTVAPEDVAYCMLDADVAPVFKPADRVDVSIRMRGVERVT